MIFFDIDNTLIDQRKAEAAAAAPFLETYGDSLACSYSIDEFCQLWRDLREQHGREFLLGRISQSEQTRRRMRALFAPQPLTNAEADARYDLFQCHYRQNWSLYDDVLPCLEALSGCSLGIVSNGGSVKQRAKLHATAIEHFFSLIVISQDARIAKPAPAIFSEVCRRAGKNPNQCVYVGDSLDDDALPSRAAGLCGFWLRRDQRSSDSLTLESLAQLPCRVRERIAA